MVFRVAMGNANGVLIAVGDVVASETKAGRVEMIEAQIDAFLGVQTASASSSNNRGYSHRHRLHRGCGQA